MVTISSSPQYKSALCFMPMYTKCKSFNYCLLVLLGYSTFNLKFPYQIRSGIYTYLSTGYQHKIRIKQTHEKKTDNVGLSANPRKYMKRTFTFSLRKSQLWHVRQLPPPSHSLVYLLLPVFEIYNPWYLPYLPEISTWHKLIAYCEGSPHWGCPISSAPANVNNNTIHTLNCFFKIVGEFFSGLLFGKDRTISSSLLLFSGSVDEYPPS